MVGGGTYVDCTIESNRGFQAAGVYADGGNPHFVSCVIRNNHTGSTEATAGIVGGVWGPAVLDGCTLTGNTAHFNAGGAFGATLNNCIVAGNSVSGEPSTSTRGDTASRAGRQDRLNRADPANRSAQRRQQQKASAKK